MEHDPQLFIVKSNDGETVRLAHFASLLKNDEPFEVVMIGLPPKEICQPMLETGRLVWWSPYARAYYEGVPGDKPSVITSKVANSPHFNPSDLATNEYVKIVRQRAATCPNVDEIGGHGEMLFVYYNQNGYAVKTLGEPLMNTTDEKESALVRASSTALARTGSQALARRGLYDLEVAEQKARGGKCCPEDQAQILFCLDHQRSHDQCPNVPHLDFALVPVKQGATLPDTLPEEIEIVTDEWTYAELETHFVLPSAHSHPVSQAWTRNGIRFASQGRHAEALICWDKALKIDALNFAAWANKGITLDYDDPQALRCFERAIEISPRCFQAWEQRGNRLYATGQLTAALECYKEATELAPSNHEFLAQKAGILLELGRYQEALACFDSVIRLSHGETGWGGKAEALHSLGRYEEALACEDKRLEIIGQNTGFTAHGRAVALADVWNHKAASHYRMGRYHDSIECCDKAIDFDPKYSNPWYNKGNNLWKLGEFENAIKCYDKALELYPGHARTWNNKGLCLRALSRLEEAVMCHEKALNCDPPEPLGWYNKARIQEDLGQIQDAISSYENYLAVAPCDGDAQAKDARNRLQVLKSGRGLDLRDQLKVLRGE